MATKLASPGALGLPVPHTSGLYADMTLDGPEIGTLVLVVDRAKNLPNRKTMGKQNPYCAARLGKEAKKTETDRRGGQTPRWDQELRFIVHDSPDYGKMKISVFSEDKRTDLVGEAWIELTDLIIPGGGKKDLWQELTFKSKYAGELRIELTYYDERPRPSESVAAPESNLSAVDEPTRFKRRPLPSNPTASHLTPDTIPQRAPPGRARHGPRDFRTPPRASTMPPDMAYARPDGELDQSHMHGTSTAHGHYGGNSAALTAHQPPAQQHQTTYDTQHELRAYGHELHQHPDFLPQLPPLPPNSRHREPHPPPRPSIDSRSVSAAPQVQPPSHLALQHSVSAPQIPQLHQMTYGHDDGHQPPAEYSEENAGAEYQYDQPEQANEDVQPPPPPMHSYSSPAVPQRFTHDHSSPISAYDVPPLDTRPASNLPLSLLPGHEQNYDTPPRGLIQASPTAVAYTTPPYPLEDDPTPSGYRSSQGPPAFAMQHTAPRQPATRHSISDPYAAYTPPRPHPLSREVPRSQSPQPYAFRDSSDATSESYTAQHQPEYRSRDGLPLIRPRPVSPQELPPASQPSSAGRSKSAYDIQFPVRSFESSDNNPLSTLQREVPASAPSSNRSTPLRKSVSPHPTPPNSAGAAPYSPDSFNVHNPNAQESMLPDGTSPRSPYQIRPGSDVLPRNGARGPIVDWHGKEVDPSDRLPVDSWAPEPEKKTPVRTYGLGRDRDFGPRTPQSGEAGSGGKSLSKDTVVNVRMRNSNPPSPYNESPSLRSRLAKKTGLAKPSSNAQPLQERPNYNSVSPPDLYGQAEPGLGSQTPPYGRTYDHRSANMAEDDALSREISSIDIGGTKHGRSGSMPAPTAYVPVRSHRDRQTFY